MPRDINEVEFTIFDTETTGLDPEAGDRIVEIAALKFKAGERIASFQALVDPAREISPAAFQVNKITPAMLAGAPPMEEVLPKFLDFIQGSYLCSYNAGFDLEFLNYELRLAGRESLKDVLALDILKMARKTLPRLQRYALWFVAQELGIRKGQAHRALADVELTWEVFKKLKAILETKGVIDFTNFAQLFSIQEDFLKNITGQKLAQIQEAIDLGVRLKIRYLSSGAEVTEREVIPKEIRQENGRGYLVGYCCLRKEERTFRIDGLLHIEII